MILKTEQIVSVSEEENRIIPRPEFRAKDGATWYLIRHDTVTWPNGNPYRLLYRTIWGSKLIGWINELGGLIFAKYA